jgi:hypothetical protein
VNLKSLGSVHVTQVAPAAKVQVQHSPARAPGLQLSQVFAQRTVTTSFPIGFMTKNCTRLISTVTLLMVPRSLGPKLMHRKNKMPHSLTSHTPTDVNHWVLPTCRGTREAPNTDLRILGCWSVKAFNHWQPEPTMTAQKDTPFRSPTTSIDQKQQSPAR